MKIKKEAEITCKGTEYFYSVSMGCVGCYRYDEFNGSLKECIRYAKENGFSPDDDCIICLIHAEDGSMTEIIKDVDPEEWYDGEYNKEKYSMEKLMRYRLF